MWINTKRILLVPLLLTVGVWAASCSINQAGSDQGTVMQGKLFTVSVSGLSGSGTASIILPESGFTLDEDTTQSFSSSSASWNTVKATELSSGQEISVSINQGGNVKTYTCSPNPFDVVSPPFISVSNSPSSATVNAGSSFTETLTITNTGGTTALITIGVTGTGMSITSNNMPSTIPAGGMGEGTIVIKASTAGSYSAGIVASTLNGNTLTNYVSVTVNSVTPKDKNPGGGSGVTPGGTTPPSFKVEYGNEFNLNVTKAGRYEFSINKTLYSFEADFGKNSKITAQELETVDTPLIGVKVYKYIEINHENDVKNITLTFSVNKDWVDDQGADPLSIILKKKDGDGPWEAKKLTYVGSDSNNYYYTLKLNTLSLFALAIDESQKTTTTPAVECKKPTKWSVCKDGVQKRTIEALSNGKCVTKQETRSCSNKAGVNWFMIFIKIVLLIVIAFVVYYMIVTRHLK